VKVLEKWRNYLILFLRAWPHFAGDVLEPQTLQSLVIIKMWQKGNKHSHEQQTGPKIEWTQCKIPSLGPMVNTYLINLFYFLRKDIELSKRYLHQCVSRFPLTLLIFSIGGPLKNTMSFCHLFLIQFCMVASVLLSTVAFPTIFILAEILQATTSGNIKKIRKRWQRWQRWHCILLGPHIEKPNISKRIFNWFGNSWHTLKKRCFVGATGLITKSKWIL